MSNIFARVLELTPRLPGWATPQKCQMLAAAVMVLRPETSVIIGVFGGRDTFALGLAHKENGKGRVMAIDPWVAVASVQGQDNPADREWWGNQQMHEDVYRMFLEHRGELGLNDVVHVSRMISDSAEPPKRIDGCLIVDGNHGPTSIRDVERFAPHVVPGAFALLDDLQWAGGYVRTARERLLDLGFRSLYQIDTSEWFQKV